MTPTNSICFLAQFPPPIHGLSKAVETLYGSRLNSKYHFSKVNIANNKRFLLSIVDLLKSDSDAVYFTPSQTRYGNLRDLFFLKLIQLRGKDCVVHIHGGYYRQLIDNDLPNWQRQMNYNAISRLTGGIVLGRSLHSIFEGLLPDNKIFVCPNCVDDTFIAQSIDEKIKSMGDGGTLHVLYLSNFIESKGYRDVLALAQLAADNGNCDKFLFHFAGKFFDRKEEAYFKAKSSGLGNVFYHGIVSGKSKINLLRQCHIFTLLSRYPNEGQPISILEAMGNGMAIITTDHAGIPEIASCENGYACEKNHINIADIYNYLLDCYSNRKKLIEVCRHNYRMVKENFTEKQYIDNMDRIFESL